MSYRKMVKTLVIGDLHLSDKIPGLLDAQVKALIKIIKSEGPNTDSLIFLGDLVTNRRPTATVLLKLKFLLEWCKEFFSYPGTIHILRGNHDSENKSDDGTTVLSLYNNLAEIHLHPNNWDDFSFIPHYEDESELKKYLAIVPEGNTVFGHFGYNGCLNSAGDEDFTIPVSAFKNPTVLGHIHKHKKHKNITILGTPYTTGYGEAGKQCYYLTIEDGEMEAHEIGFGPRHLVLPFDKLEENLEYINDPNYFTMLRVLLSSFTETENISQFINEHIDVAHVDIKYKPQFKDNRDMPELSSEEFAVDINKELIDKYIEESSTNLSREELLDGLKLIHENK